MKNLRVIPLILITLFWSVSCSEDFLNVSPPGSYSAPSLQNAKGVEGMLIATYSALDGSWFEDWGNNHFNQNGGASNWIWGSVRSDDSYKGTEASDGPDLTLIMQNALTAEMGYPNDKWNSNYDGIGKANATLSNLALATDLTDAQALRIEGEARFLRAHFHFEGVKVFGRVPFVDETVTDFPSVANVPSSGSVQGDWDNFIWSDIEADLQFAYDNLPDQMSAPGRANRAAAGALLAKVKMFHGDWAGAEPILDDVIANGTTAAGAPLTLMGHFFDNFRADKEAGNTEVMFAYEASYQDGTIANGSYEHTLNVPHGSSARTACCGFFQPSQNMANSFKTDASGLPLPDTFNDSDIANDDGVPATDPFTPEAGNLDSRIDWTLGRRGVPYLDWYDLTTGARILNPGSTNGWVRAPTFGGPYNPTKSVPTMAEFDANLAGVIDWGFVSMAKNVNIIRFADVLLLGAECKAELGKLADAVTLVNRVRARAADPQTFQLALDDVTPAANYFVGQFTSFASAAEALKFIRFERKLELAQEGHRFFDLVRWHMNSGKSALAFDMKDYMNNDYYAVERTKRSAALTAAVFDDRDYLSPIPTVVITQSTVAGNENITQNPGW